MFSGEKIKVLYINNQEEDYLADGFLIGLLKNSTVEVWQCPVKEILYKKNKGKFDIRGKGFTLYYLLEDYPIKNINFLNSDNTFDLIIFSSIQRQFYLFKKWLSKLKHKQVWVLDGEDTPALYLFHGYYWRRPYLWFFPKAHTRFIYFKREWTPDTLYYLHYKLIPKYFIKYIQAPRKLRPISFSIPREKICSFVPEKIKLFPKHIVDQEVAMYLEGSFTTYVFTSEEEYYKDLQQSMYGITTKRSGWDCLRHYEIAANGAVICFRDLHKKPETCAPHGLLDGINCISYSSFDDLMKKINAIDDDSYLKLQSNCHNWSKMNSSERVIERLLRMEFKGDFLLS